MRELKFRAYDSNYGEMYYFDLPRYMSSHEDAQEDLCPSLLADKLMQYTGLKDVNGKLIYKGDILHNIKSEYDSKMYGVVEYGETDACFNVIWYKNVYGEEWEQYLFEPVQLDEVVVVGNIFENSDLLEEDK